MARVSTKFICQQCGFNSPKWLGQCPNCSAWNTLVETEVDKKKVSGNFATHSTISKEPVVLSQVKKSEYGLRTPTNIAELDRVLGGGIVPGMVTLIAGEPGIGKSTLLLQIAHNISGKVIYIAGEESATQIASRAGRLGAVGDNISVLEETDVDQVLEVLERVSKESSVSKVSKALDTRGTLGTLPSLVIVDSIQTMTTSDLNGAAGSIGQVRECAARLTNYAKRTGVPVFIVGHVTKEGTIAGPRVLEHMVDTVLWFEGDRREFLRIIRAVKNRFGATDEVGIFAMEEKGLSQVSNPSSLFLGENGTQAGSAIAVVLEGTRPILVEIQALVAPTKLAFPKRSASGVDPRRLEILIAVLSRRCGLPLWDYDVFVNAAGGIKITEPAADLAIALALVSAFQDKALASHSFAIGEVGLLGEVREVAQLDRRIKEASRLGFKNAITARQSRYLAQIITKSLPKN